MFPLEKPTPLSMFLFPQRSLAEDPACECMASTQPATAQGPLRETAAKAYLLILRPKKTLAIIQ